MGLQVIRDDTAKLDERIAELKALKLSVGYTRQSGGREIHPDSEITVAKLAAIHEWGSPSDNIPARSFIRRTMHERRREIADELKRAVKAAVEGKITPVQAYARVGKLVLGLIRAKLESASGWAKPLQAATAEEKGHARVLSDTRTLITSLAWRVSKGRQTVAEGQ